MNSLLLTGASGFVGRFVASDLVRKGIPVVCAARADPKIQGTRFHPIFNIDGNTDWTDALRGIENIIHGAGRAHVLRGRTANSYAEFRATNFEGTLQLARQAASQGVKRFVFISSIGVNGTSTIRPFTEKDVPAPKGMYAQLKLEAEHSLDQIAERTGMQVAIVRPPLVYGPNCPGNFLRLLRLVYSDLPLPLGGINNRRNLVGIWNLSDFLIRCAMDDRASNKTFVIADQETISTSDLLKIISRCMNRPLRMFSVPKGLVSTVAKISRQDRVVEGLWGNLEIDSTFARSELEWMQPVALLDGLCITSEWYARSRQAV